MRRFQALLIAAGLAAAPASAVAGPSNQETPQTVEKFAQRLISQAGQLACRGRLGGDAHWFRYCRLRYHRPGHRPQHGHCRASENSAPHEIAP